MIHARRHRKRPRMPARPPSRQPGRCTASTARQTNSPTAFESAGKHNLASLRLRLRNLPFHDLFTHMNKSKRPIVRIFTGALPARASLQPGDRIPIKMAKESSASIFGAIIANFAIAAAKLLAAILGKSSAMLSEGIHSSIDGINDLLLLFGLKQSRRPADDQHPFGYGKDLYFWSLIVSCSVLGIGGGVTITEGVRNIMQPTRIEHAQWAFLALGCGVLFDAGSFLYGMRQFRRQNLGKRLWRAIDETKDPSSLMVIFEDSTGFLGEILAAAGIVLNQHGWLRCDGIASVLIGCLLAAMAIFLIAQTRDLVVGEGVEEDISRTIRELAIGEHKFLSVRATHTMHFGPETVLVTMDTVFDPQRSAGELMEAVDRIQQTIRERYPAVKFVYIDPESREHQKSNSSIPTNSQATPQLSSLAGMH